MQWQPFLLLHSIRVGSMIPLQVGKFIICLIVALHIKPTALDVTDLLPHATLIQEGESNIIYQVAASRLQVSPSLFDTSPEH
jgi:hypothetical protein